MIEGRASQRNSKKGILLFPRFALEGIISSMNTLRILYLISLVCPSLGFADLIAHYTFDDAAASGLALDSAGGDDNGTVGAGVTQGDATAKFGTSILFNGGTGSAITLANGSGINTPTDDFTITMWVRPDFLGRNFDRMYETMDTGNQNGIRIDTGGAPGTSFRALIRQGGTPNQITHATPLTVPEVWHFAAIRYSSAGQLSVSLLQDAASYTSSDVTSATQSSNATLGPINTHAIGPFVGSRLANGASGQDYRGRMDDFAFFNTVLSDSDLALVASSGAASLIPEPSIASLLLLGLLLLRPALRRG